MLDQNLGGPELESYQRHFFSYFQFLPAYFSNCYLFMFTFQFFVSIVFLLSIKYGALKPNPLSSQILAKTNTTYLDRYCYLNLMDVGRMDTRGSAIKKSIHLMTFRYPSLHLHMSSTNGDSRCVFRLERRPMSNNNGDYRMQIKQFSFSGNYQKNPYSG